MFHRLHEKIENGIGSQFEKYGRFVSRHPLKIIIVVIIVDLGLGLGLLRLTKESGIEQYTPSNSRASRDRDTIRNLFHYNTSQNFYQHNLADFGYFGSVIIERKDGGNILQLSMWQNIKEVYSFINATSAFDEENNEFTYSNICARRFARCVVDGDIIFGQEFMSDMKTGNISYPVYANQGQGTLIDTFIGGVKVKDGFITDAKAIKLTFYLDSERTQLSRKWELSFTDKMGTFNSSVLQVKYAYSDSLTVELSKSVTGDILFFSVTFFLMIQFSSLVLFGGNCVTNRYNLGFAGVVGTGLAIVGSFGFVSLCGVTFVDIVGAMPFLILGIGVDDMFILLSGLAETSTDDDIETRMGYTMWASGISVTITSITDVIAFCAGAASVFPCVVHFSLYTGCAILFCYLNNITFFTACMTINEKRVYQHVHSFTCMKVKSEEEMKRAGESNCKILCCSGSLPKQRADIEGPIEKYPKKLVKKIVSSKRMQILIIFMFTLYLGFSIWGASRFKDDLDLRDLVSTDSYYYDYYDTDRNMFSLRLAVSLNIPETINYRSEKTLKAIDTLLNNFKDDEFNSDISTISWYIAYSASPLFDNTSDISFISSLQKFIASPNGNVFINDVVLDSASNSITASRFYIITEDISTFSSSVQSTMTVRVREIVDASSLPVFAYSPAFIFFEQYIKIVPQTLQTLGVCVAVIFVITAIFIPLPFIVLLITITVVMIMTGVIGFMNFWGLTLNSVTMIHIIMCVGFCIDFSTHICHAFVQTEGSRQERVAQALDKVGGPIFNGAMSTIIGVLMLAFSSSYIFFSFFKVMFLVMGFGLLHSIFLLPVVLSFIGPTYKDESVIPYINLD